MSSSSIEAGEAWISISVKNEKLKQGLYEASKKITGFSNEMREAEKKIAPTVSVKGIDRTLRLLDRFRQKTAEIGQGIQNDFFEDMLAIKGIFWAISTSIHAAADALGGFGDQFNKMSGRTGLGTGFLSEYAYVAEMSGSSAEAVENAIRKTQRLIGEASVFDQGRQLRFGFRS